jgi:hypothetical protein
MIGATIKTTPEIKRILPPPLAFSEVALRLTRKSAKTVIAAPEIKEANANCSAMSDNIALTTNKNSGPPFPFMIEGSFPFILSTSQGTSGGASAETAVAAGYLFPSDEYFILIPSYLVWALKTRALG